MKDFDIKQKLKQEILLGKISISMLQRHLKIGYPTACKIMDNLCDKKYVSAIVSEGIKRYTILDSKNTIKTLSQYLKD